MESRQGTTTEPSPQPSSSQGGHTVSSPGGVIPACQDHRWQIYADSAQIDEEGLRDLYVSALAEAKYETTELQEVHILADKMQPSLDPRSPKVRAILRDMKQMDESLPVHPDSAIYVRQVRTAINRHPSLPTT